MENRLKEIAGNLKRDVRDLLDESASIVTGLFKQGLCTANGMAKRWNAFTHGLSQSAKSLFEPFSHVPMIAENQQPIVTVKESACEELPVGTRMTLAEAEERIAELDLSMLDSGGLIQDVRVVSVENVMGFWTAVAKAPGTAKLTATAPDGKTGSVTITVTPAAAQPSPEPGARADLDLTANMEIRQEMIRLINEVRRKNGAGELASISFSQPYRSIHPFFPGETDGRID